MKHITEYSRANGRNFNGYRVIMMKKGVIFCKYVPITKIGWDAARKKAIEVERDLSEKLSKCGTREEVIALYEEWK